jgi:hypothetical protein
MILLLKIKVLTNLICDNLIVCRIVDLVYRIFNIKIDNKNNDNKININYLFRKD